MQPLSKKYRNHSTSVHRMPKSEWPVGNVRQCLFIKNYIQIETSNKLKSCGYLIQDQKFCPLNFILVIARKYIFWCSQNRTDPKIDLFKTEIK